MFITICVFLFTLYPWFQEILSKIKVAYVMTVSLSHSTPETMSFFTKDQKMILVLFELPFVLRLDYC